MELKELQAGISTFDSFRKQEFTLRANLVVVSGRLSLHPCVLLLTTCLGDGPAIAEAIGMKTPGNAKVPCRFCYITATKSTTTSHTHYYIPHTPTQANGGLIIREDLRWEIERSVQATKEARDAFGR